jgi:hypothetical protein
MERFAPEIQVVAAARMLYLFTPFFSDFRPFSGLDYSYATDAIGASFTRACQFLGLWTYNSMTCAIMAFSRLFETGLSFEASELAWQAQME